MLSSAQTQEMSRFFSLSTVYVIIFAAVAVLGALVSRFVYGKNKESEEKYESVFSDSNDNN